MNAPDGETLRALDAVDAGHRVQAHQIALLLPRSGYATLTVVSRFDAIDRQLGLLISAIAARPRFDALRAERARLSVAIVHRLRPADLELRHPEGPAPRREVDAAR